MPNEELNYIPTRYLSIEIELDNGKVFPNGSSKAIFNCDSTTAGDGVLAGGFTVNCSITKTNALMNNTANVTIFGLDEAWTSPMDKAIPLQNLNLTQNWITIYSGYRLNSDGLPDYQFSGAIRSAMVDQRKGQKALVISSMGMLRDLYTTVGKPITTDGTELLTSLFDRIIQESPEFEMIQNEYLIPNPQKVYAAHNTTYTGGWLTMLRSACEDNNCYAPTQEKNIIKIVSKNWVDSEAAVLILDENNIKDHPYPAEGDANQAGVDVRFSGQLKMLQKIRIEGRYDTQYTSQEWYINSLHIVLNNRGKEWYYQVGLGTYPNNIPIADSELNNTPQSANGTQILQLTKLLNAHPSLGATLPASVSVEQQENAGTDIQIPYDASLDLASTLAFCFQQYRKSLNTAIICEVLEVNNAKNLYTIRELLCLINYNNTYITPRTVHNIPAMFPPYMKIDLNKGDIVQVVCNQYDITNIKQNNYQQSFQASIRRLSLSDAVIIGKPQDLNDDNNTIHLTKNSADIKFEDHITFQIEDNTTVQIDSNHVKITRGSSSVDIKNDGIYVDGPAINLGSKSLKKVLTEGTIVLSVDPTDEQELTLTGVQPSSTAPATKCIVSGGILKIVAGGSPKVKAEGL